jgi:hypothetical protein
MQSRVQLWKIIPIESYLSSQHMYSFTNGAWLTIFPPPVQVLPPSSQELLFTNTPGFTGILGESPPNQQMNAQVTSSTKKQMKQQKHVTTSRQQQSTQTYLIWIISCILHTFALLLHVSLLMDSLWAKQQWPCMKGHVLWSPYWSDRTTDNAREDCSWTTVKLRKAMNYEFTMYTLKRCSTCTWLNSQIWVYALL